MQRKHSVREPPYASREVLRQARNGVFLSLQTAFPQSEAKPIPAYQGGLSRRRGTRFWRVTIEAPPNPFENFQDELLGAGYPSFPIP